MLTGRARWQEIMREPISRGEAMAMEERLMMNVGSTAAGIEALENILISKGLLEKEQLMSAVKELIKVKTDQSAAAIATESPITQAV